MVCRVPARAELALNVLSDLACVHGNADCISATYHNLPIVWVSLIRIQLKCFTLSLSACGVCGVYVGWLLVSPWSCLSYLAEFMLFAALRVPHGPSFFILLSRNHIHCIACIFADRVAHGPSFLFVSSHFLFRVSPLRFVLSSVSVASAVTMFLSLPHFHCHRVP